MLTFIEIESVKILTFYISIIVVMAILVLINGLGTIIGGWLSGYEFLGIQFSNHILIRQSGRFQWKKRIGFDGIIMTVRDTDNINSFSTFGYLHGSSVFLAAVLIIATTSLLSCEFSSALVRYFLLTFVVFGWLYFIYKLFSGYNLRVKNKHNYLTCEKILKHNLMESHSKLPSIIYDEAPLQKGDDRYTLSNRIDYIHHLIIAKEYEKAANIINNTDEGCFSRFLLRLYKLELIIYELFTLRRIDVLDELWTPSLKSFCTLNTFQMWLITINYAMELLVYRRNDIAQKWMNTFEVKKEDYYKPVVDACEPLLYRAHEIYMIEVGDKEGQSVNEHFNVDNKTDEYFKLKQKSIFSRTMILLLVGVGFFIAWLSR